jgi:hypothetical protein
MFDNSKNHFQGHLDQLLCEKFGYKVLGLEAQGSVVKTATLRHNTNVSEKNS